MFESKNIVYADPGKYLIGNHKVGYQFPGELSEFEEKEVDIKVTKKGTVIYIIMDYSELG